MPANAVGLCRAGPPLVPRQSAAPRGAAFAGPALDLATSPPDGYRVLSYRPAVACLPTTRHPDLVAGAIRPTGVFSQGLFPFSAMARTGSGLGRLGVRRNDGDADRAEATRVRCPADPVRSPQAIWRRLSGIPRYRP